MDPYTDDIFSENDLEPMGTLALYADVETLALSLSIAANDGDEVVKKWMDRLYRYGASERFLIDLRQLVRPIKMIASLELLNDRFSWTYARPHDVERWSKESIIALYLTRIVNEDMADNVKRCQREKCRKYFWGGPRKQYCSDNCGTYDRIDRKRWKDRKDKGL